METAAAEIPTAAARELPAGWACAEFLDGLAVAHPVGWQRHADGSGHILVPYDSLEVGGSPLEVFGVNALQLDEGGAPDAAEVVQLAYAAAAEFGAWMKPRGRLETLEAGGRRYRGMTFGGAAPHGVQARFHFGGSRVNACSSAGMPARSGS